jgi:hypothetical protein
MTKWEAFSRLIDAHIYTQIADVAPFEFMQFRAGGNA